MDELKKFYNEVSKVAYDLFEKRGKLHGHDTADWLKAEMIVKKRYEDKIKPEAQTAKSKNKATPDKKSKAKFIK